MKEVSRVAEVPFGRRVVTAKKGLPVFDLEDSVAAEIKVTSVPKPNIPFGQSFEVVEFPDRCTQVVIWEDKTVPAVCISYQGALCKAEARVVKSYSAPSISEANAWE